MRSLRIRFSLYGFVIVILQALPNVAWALFPPAVDALEGNASSIQFVEYGEHVLGVSIVVLLLFLVRQGQEKVVPKNRSAVAAYVAIMFYWACWALYFCAIQPLPVIYAMVVLPPIAFFCAGAAEKVYPVSVASALFLCFHLAVAAENFQIGSKPF